MENNGRGNLRQGGGARMKVKVYKLAVSPAMLYGLETVALTIRQWAGMEVAEVKMLRLCSSDKNGQDLE